MFVLSQLLVHSIRNDWNFAFWVDIDWTQKLIRNFCVCTSVMYSGSIAETQLKKRSTWLQLFLVWLVLYSGQDAIMPVHHCTLGSHHWIYIVSVIYLHSLSSLYHLLCNFMTYYCFRLPSDHVIKFCLNIYYIILSQTYYLLFTGSTWNDNVTKSRNLL